MFEAAPILAAVARTARAGAAFTALLLAAPAAFATNLVVNSGFDGGSAGWNLHAEAGRYSSEWRPEDATGDPGSGSVRVQHLGDLASAYTAATQCLPVMEGASYLVLARLRIPVGQSAPGGAQVSVSWSSAPNCDAGFIVGMSPIQLSTPNDWFSDSAVVVAPGGARGARLQLDVWVNVPGAPLFADFDDLGFDDGAAGDPPPPYGSWISSSDLPGFEAQVRITADATPLQGAKESDCIDETICVSGALAGRPEVFVKVIGPRPNGFYWLQLIRFTPSQVEVWLRQKSSQQINYYLIGAVTGGVLRGLEDREAFLP